MLNWICPDCGRECSPTSRECPSCAEQAQIAAQATPAPAGVLALAKGVEDEPSTGLMSAGAETSRTHSFNGTEESGRSTSSLLVEEPSVHQHAEPAGYSEPSGRTLDAFVENLEEQISSHAAAPPPIESSVEQLVASTLQSDPVCEPQPELTNQEAIGAIVDSFREQPRTLLLAAPEHVQYEAPPVTSFCALDRPFAAQPRDTSQSLPLAAPQPLLLPGPCLPADLRNLRSSKAHTAPAGARKLRLPAWVLTLIAAVLLVLLVGSIMQNVNANREARAASVPTETAAQSPTTPEAVPSDAHPFGRYVEVTGVRVVADPQRRSQLQYLVVNHSNIQITNIVLHINVRSADPSSKAPLIQVSAMIPSLGAYESKEIRTDLDTQIRSTEIPDWDHLKVDVQVTSR
jgi:hypothetical protein